MIEKSKKVKHMYEQVEKPKGNKKRAVVNTGVQGKNTKKQDFGFVDNRPVSSSLQLIRKADTGTVQRQETWIEWAKKHKYKIAGTGITAITAAGLYWWFNKKGGDASSLGSSGNMVATATKALKGTTPNDVIPKGVIVNNQEESWLNKILKGWLGQAGGGIAGKTQAVFEQLSEEITDYDKLITDFTDMGHNT